MSYALDISASLAISAFSGTSFSPEKRGESARTEYAETLAGDYAHFAAQADKGGTIDLLESEFERYRAGYATHYRAWLTSSSRCMSTMIAGPSNFPVRRMQKRNDIAHKRCTDLIEFRDRARKSVIRKLRPDLAPIMAGDGDAVQRLQAELDKLQAMQTRMKAINAAHKRFMKDPASLDTADFSDAEKNVIRNYKPTYSWEPHPFAPFQITNNGANIRRVEGRIKSLSAIKAMPEKAIECASGLRVEDCPADNRVRLFFPGKPDADVRAKLKSNGFRWSPTIGAWQAYRNSRAMELAQAFVWDEKRQAEAVAA